jgi:hypothetical protein
VFDRQNYICARAAKSGPNKIWMIITMSNPSSAFHPLRPSNQHHRWQQYDDKEDDDSSNVNYDKHDNTDNNSGNARMAI